MGFYISDYETELRQHINLSESAWLVIDEDVKSFGNGGKYNLAGFLNRVFTNFYQDAEATVSQRRMSKEEELVKLFSSDEFKAMDNSVTKTYITKIVDVYTQELLEKIGKYEKGRGQKVRINKENVEILRESSEAEFYNNSIGAYVKAVFEEYASKPMFEREQIYFKETVDGILSAIALKKKVKISILKKIDSESRESYTRKFYLTPYKIMQDKTRMYNYAVGYSEEIKEDGALLPRTVVCYRISRIDHLLVLSSKGGYLSKADRDEIDEKIERKELQFLAGDVIELKVRFTDKGLENFNRQLYLRPHEYQVVEGEDNVYVFNCTEMQAINYFFKFGRDVEILSPEETRERFAKRYRDAYDRYAK